MYPYQEFFLLDRMISVVVVIIVIVNFAVRFARHKNNGLGIGRL